MEPKKSPGGKSKQISSPEVLAISKQGEVFQAHPNGVILKLALGPRMMDRLKQALEMEKSLCQFGVKEVMANGLFAGFLTQGLTQYEAKFPHRKSKFEAKAKVSTATLPGSRRWTKDQQRRMEEITAYLPKIEKVAAALDAGDADPQKRIIKESIAHHRERMNSKKNQITNHEKLIERLETVSKALEAGDLGPAKVFAAEAVAKNRAFLRELQEEYAARS